MSEDNLKMISVIVTSRVDGNINHNLKELLRSLNEHSRDPKDIELLVKFDDDDNMAQEVYEEIMNYPGEVMIKALWGPRNRGYTDIHLGYNQLLTHVASDSKIIIAMADDFRAERDWDNALCNSVKDAGEYFIIHQRKHPVLHVADLSFSPSFNMDETLNPFEKGANLYIIDEAPAWSPALLKICTPGSGTEYPSKFYQRETFPVSFTDAWTLCLEYCLWHNHGINITRFLPDLFISRKTCEVDQPGNDRWTTDRKENFEFIKSEGFKNIVTWQAREISLRINQMSGVK